MLAIIFPQIDPIAFSIFAFDVRWYSLAYIVGILIAYYLLVLLARSAGNILKRELLDDLVFYSTIGIVLGGRLGFVLFYNLKYSLSNPLSILKTWEGGMSFHGAVIGLACAIYFLSRKYNIALFTVVDLICCVAPPGIFLGRLANLINCELYGRVSEVSWAVVFPCVDASTRHPSQLYEAFGEGVLLFMLMQYLFHYTKIYENRGALTGVFLCGYSIVRALAECFREPDVHLGVLLDHFTMGQLLSLPMFILGLFLLLRSYLNRNKNEVSYFRNL